MISLLFMRWFLNYTSTTFLTISPILSPLYTSLCFDS
jgi:hypothetical protein